jgi:hypothetical protein
MKSPIRSYSQSTVWRLTLASYALFSLFSSTNLCAQGVLAYSFEDDALPDPLQGFVANFATPNGIAVSQDTIGATDGTKSLKMSLIAAEFYAGALTSQLDPSIFSNPPGIISLSFDLYIETAFPTEGFVDIFPVFFGIQEEFPNIAHEVSFQDTNTPVDSKSRIAVGDLATGVTHPITMVLEKAFHPIDFENFAARPYNEIFGDGSSDIDLIPTSFQITVNKSATSPWVAYVDNVRFSSVEGTPGDFDVDGDVDGRDFLVWQRGGTTPALDPALLAEWQTNYGMGGLMAGFTAVPEPTCGLLAIMTIAVGLTCSRNR